MTTATFVILSALFIWAMAEAFSWPVVPDAALAVFVFWVPELATPAAAVVIIGSAVGGALAIRLYRRGHRWPLPAVTDRMTERVAEWLDRGPIGLVHQPLSAVPYKVFVVDASGRDIGVTTWVMLTVAFRGPRIAATAAFAALGAHGIEQVVPGTIEWPAKAVALTAWLVVFAIGWRLAWSAWARDADASAGDNTRSITEDSAKRARRRVDRSPAGFARRMAP
jgi:hypothetical protein